MSDFPDFMKNLLGIFHIIHPDSGTWVNVGKLNSDDILKKKRHDMDCRRLWSEGKVLYNKLQVIHATLEANKAEFWDGIYKAYSLPSDLNYRVDDTGQISKHVPAPPSQEGSNAG